MPKRSQIRLVSASLDEPENIFIFGILLFKSINKDSRLLNGIKMSRKLLVFKIFQIDFRFNENRIKLSVH